jgi:hypothetical protein
MKISIAHLRAKNVDREMIAEIERLLEADAERREKARIVKRNQRSRPVDCPQDRQKAEQKQQPRPVCPVDRGGSLTTSLDKPLTVSQQKQVELVAPATPARSEKYPPEFLRFYVVYPRKEAKQAALKAWRRALARGVTNDALIAGAQRYAADPNRDPGYTKHPATWLNAGCQDDEPLPRRGGQNGQGRRHGSVLDAADRLREKLNAQGSFAEDYVPGSSGPTPLRLDTPVRPAGLRVIPKR